MPQIEIVSLDTYAWEDNDLADSGYVGSITRLCRRRRPEFENGTHATSSEIGPVDSCAPVLVRKLAPADGTI